MQKLIVLTIACLFIALLSTAQQDTVISNQGTFTDERDGQVYKWVKIGRQIWMAENLNYAASSGSWCYDNDISNCAVYGRLYNLKTSKTVCPVGWHLPSDESWLELVTFLGGDYFGHGNNAGGKMKTIGTIEEGTGLWSAPNEGATNSSGFNGLPAGTRTPDRKFKVLGYTGFFWSSPKSSTSGAWKRVLATGFADIGLIMVSKKGSYSVRCLKD